MKLPGSTTLAKLLRGFRSQSMQAIWTRKWRRRLHKDEESVSGAGSSISETEVVRRELPALLAELGARSLLDIPCGDFHWMQEVDLGVERYVGADVVSALVDENQRLHGDAIRSFRQLDATRDDLPEVDLIFCRDCLMHLSFDSVKAALRNFKRSGARYLLTTIYADKTEHHDIETGRWNAINLRLPPFELPEPLRVINEQSGKAGERFRDKSLALWRIDQIPDFAD